jgi:hypothetical protein
MYFILYLLKLLKVIAHYPYFLAGVARLSYVDCQMLLGRLAAGRFDLGRLVTERYVDAMHSLDHKIIKRKNGK